MAKHFISILDWSPDQHRAALNRARVFKQGREDTRLPGTALALLFEKPSLRTRVSFDMAMYQLGGHCIYLSPAEVGLGQRESARDTAQVLSRYVNAIAARTFAHRTLEELAQFGSVPVINALSDQEHPCQALADF
ncbi:MAG: ornithine carbamoyltransferase, partial [Chloroflexota bacterium]